MVNQAQKSQDLKLHWFWNLTTKWWFFPLFAYLLSFLYLLIFDSGQLFYYDITWSLWLTFGMFISIPSGIAYFIIAVIQLITGWNMFFVGGIVIMLTSATFYVYFAVSIFKIVKSKENKIFKKRIITLFLLIILSFIGIILSNYYRINSSFV